MTKNKSIAPRTIRLKLSTAKVIEKEAKKQDRSQHYIIVKALEKAFGK